MKSEPDGVAVDLEGFRSNALPVGAPDLPVRTWLVAIPPGSQPTLHVRAFGESALAARAPRPVADRIAGPSRRDAAFYGRDAVYPEQVAWLGETGVLRDQAYVEVLVAPVRYDARSGRLLRVGRVELTVDFGVEPTASYLRPADDGFESVYADAFVNYEQGRTFRTSVSEPSAPAPAAGEGASATTGGGIGPLYRIRVRQDGMIRLDHAALQPTGFLAHDVHTWRLTGAGLDVPLRIEDDGDGVIEPGEWVQFWGEALIGEPETALNTDVPNSPFDLFEARDYTDENVYFLSVEIQAQPALPQRDAAPTMTRTPPASFTDTARLETDDRFQPLGSADPWFWGPTLDVAGATLPNPSRTDGVALPGLADPMAPAQVRVQVRGLVNSTTVNPDHEARVTLSNGAAQAVGSSQETFDGDTLHLFDFTAVPGMASPLSDPSSVTLEVFDTGAVCGGLPCDRVLLDWIEVDYARSFTAAGERLAFTWPDGDAEFLVHGLADATPEIWELTPSATVGQPAQAVRLLNAATSGAGPFSVRFRVDNDPGLADGTPRQFVVVGDGGVTIPAGGDFESDTVSDLRDTTNQADLIVIAHPSVLDATTGGTFDQWLTWRQSPAGGGLSVKVAMIQDVQDEFNHGVAGAGAVKEFLRYVLSTQPGEGWADPRPAYVLLLGDGSIDTKGGPAKGELIPTQVVFDWDPTLGYYASDNLLAAVVGADSMPDLKIGRIPSRSVADTNRILQKTLDHEQVVSPGSWQRNVLFISDRGKIGNNPAEALQFESMNDNSAAEMTGAGPFTTLHLRYWTDYFNTLDPTPWDSINADIKASVNGTDGLADGNAITQYVGHGNFVLWSDDFFFDERFNPPDSADLVNGTRLPWLVAHNCLTGGFHITTTNNVAERWLNRDNGGAASVFAPTGLSFNFIGNVVATGLFDSMFGPRHVREVGTLTLGTAVTLCGQGSIPSCQYYVLLGDPALRLALRTVDDAENLQALAGNAQVDLSWDASATAGVVYDIYRSRFPTLNYALVQSTAATTYLDTGVINAETYYYYVVARDAQGFVSGWSNLNLDCGVSGPGCVSATPLNPNAPTKPTGVFVEDPGTGTVLRVHWTPNPETDVASYTVHSGPSAGNYTSSVQVDGDVTQVAVFDVVLGQPSFFAVSATNTSGKTSVLSDEVSDFPVFAPGLRYPDFIEDLQVARQGSDLQLTWGEVSTDAYGKPLTVVKYQIFRGSFPDFSTASLTMIDECLAPCSGYVDPGAATAPSSWHYRVRAVDGADVAGSLGAEAPNGTVLEVFRSMTVPGDLRLQWDPVLETLDGSTAHVVRYDVYASDQPFGREEIRAGQVAPLTSTTETFVELTPGAPNGYYSVLAVDRQGNLSPY